MPDSITQKAMDKLAFFEGNWTGHGWIQFGPQKHEFDQKEIITRKLNNSVIVIDGMGKSKETGEVIHQAHATINYDPQKGRYQMVAYRGDGKRVDAAAWLDDTGAFIWSFFHPMGGEMQYTIRVKDGVWKEVGQMKQGDSWYTFLEMELGKE
jgi:hypothetical protein